MAMAVSFEIVKSFVTDIDTGKPDPDRCRHDHRCICAHYRILYRYMYTICSTALIVSRLQRWSGSKNSTESSP